MSMIKTPHAAVIIWNYRDRFSSMPIDTASHIPDPHAVDVIRLDKSIISIDIQKQKAVSSGAFSMVLAPTKNWLALLTPGSWLAILMSQTPFTKNDLYVKANAKQVKMLGRIESVRASANVSASGTRTTVYTVTGVDWGTVFDTVLYIDPISRGSEEDTLSFSQRLFYGAYMASSGGEMQWSSDQNLAALLMMWGLSVDTGNKDLPKNVIIRANVAFRFPSDLVTFFKFKESDLFTSIDKMPPSLRETVQSIKIESTSNDVARLVVPYLGKVTRENSAPVNGVFFDQYTPVAEGWCILSADSVTGQNQMWQILNDACNPVLNELICDMRWEFGPNGDSVPVLALYKRFRPFLVRDIDEIAATAGKDLSDASRRATMGKIAARFFDLRTVQIPLKEIVSVEAGNNWRDKYNFVEILYDHQLKDAALNSSMKLTSQSFDTMAFSREGFRPRMESCRYWPDIDLLASAKTVTQPTPTSHVASTKTATATAITAAKDKAYIKKIRDEVIQADAAVKKWSNEKDRLYMVIEITESGSISLTAKGPIRPSVRQQFIDAKADFQVKYKEFNDLDLKEKGINWHSENWYSRKRVYEVAQGKLKTIGKKLDMLVAQQDNAEKEYDAAVLRAEKLNSTRDILAKKAAEEQRAAKIAKNTKAPVKKLVAPPTVDTGVNAAVTGMQTLLNSDPILIINTLIWKYLLREWYFNTHLMLNGTINFIGQDNYIQVGDNIMFPLRAFNFQSNLTQAALKNKPKATIERNTNELAEDPNEPWILAHVENIAHRMSMSDSAARSFMTSIHFIRGVIVDKDRKPLSSSTTEWAHMTTGGMLDKTTDETPRQDLSNKENVVSSIAPLNSLWNSSDEKE